MCGSPVEAKRTVAASMFLNRRCASRGESASHDFYSAPLKMADDHAHAFERRSAPTADEINIAADISRMVHPPELTRESALRGRRLTTRLQQSSKGAACCEVDREKALALFHELSNGLYAVKALLEDYDDSAGERKRERERAGRPSSSEGAGSFSIGDDDYSSRMSRHSEIGGLSTRAVDPGRRPTRVGLERGRRDARRARATGGVGTATGALGNEVINDLREKLRQAQQAAAAASAAANTERSRRLAAEAKLHELGQSPPDYSSMPSLEGLSISDGGPRLCSRRRTRRGRPSWMASGKRAASFRASFRSRTVREAPCRPSDNRSRGR